VASGDGATGVGAGAAPDPGTGTAGGGSFDAEVSNARANGSQRVGSAPLNQAGIPGLPGSGPFGRLSHLVPLASLLSTTTTLALAFLIFGKKRRDEEAPASDEDLASAAASPYSMIGAGLAPAFAGVDPGTGGTDVELPRWRRPSLLAARKSDPIRNGAEHVSLTFTSQSGSGAGGERCVVRYRLVQLLDRPDELLGQAVDSVDEGDQVEILERRGTYRRVVTPDGREGWLHRMTLGDLVTQDPAGYVPAVPDEDVVLAYLSAHGRR
jgi:hypothetical protein